MKKIRFLAKLLFIILLFLPLVSSAQCPPPGYPDYTIDCQNGYCCSNAYPVCCYDNANGPWCCVEGSTCCSDLYGTYGCCPPNTVCCYDQYGHADCCPTVSTTSSIHPTTTTTTIASGIIGAPCSSPSDCGQGTECYTGTSFPGGYCTKQCTSNANCGADNLCITFNQGTPNEISICLDGCTTNTDCRAGYNCLNAGEGSVCFTGGSGSTTTSTVIGSGNYLTAINTKGDANNSTQSSGTLPGSNPSETNSLIKFAQQERIDLIIQDRFFPPLDKSLLVKTIAALKAKQLAKQEVFTTYSVGDQKKFWIKDDNDAVWRQVTATTRKESAHSYIFVDNMLSSFSDTNVNTYATEFELMYQIIFDNIGNFSDRDGNGKIAILIYDINDNSSVSTGWLAGYFWAKDYFNDAETMTQGNHSNEMDVIYIRGDEPAGWSSEYGSFAELTLSTLIHEYQHLVHFCVTFWQPQLDGKTGDTDDVWINEMMSMASETMYFKKKLEINPAYTHQGMALGGYLESRIRYYNNDPQNTIRNGHGLAYWDNDGDVYANYALSYIFGQYLATHASNGQGIFKEILNYMLQNVVFDYRAVESVATQRIGGVGNWSELLKNWAIANMLNQPSGLYGYKNAFALTPHGPTSSLVNMHNGGIVYRQIDSGCPSPVGAGPDIRYFCFNANDTPPTTSIPSGTTTTSTATLTTTTTIEYDCPPERPVNCFNGFCCPANKPICGTGDKTGQCFRWRMCAASYLFGKDAYETNLLRALRDNILVKNATGNRLAFSYYQHAGELLLIMERNPELRRETKKLIVEILPELEGILNGKQVYFDNVLSQKINLLCDMIAQKASPKLAETIFDIKADFNSGKLLKDLEINQ